MDISQNSQYSAQNRISGVGYFNIYPMFSFHTKKFATKVYDAPYST